MKRRRRGRKGGSKLRLGPGGLVYLVVTGLILGAAIYTQANLLFWSFGLLVGGLAISVMLSWQMLRGITIQRLLPSHGVCGEPMAIRYHVTNGSWLPAFGVMVQETWGRSGLIGLLRRQGWRRVGPVAELPQRLKGRPHGWVLHIGPNQVIQAEATCWPLRRGMLRFERIVVSSSFPFGIIRKIVEFPQPAQVLIYPHLYRMNRRILYSLSNLDPSGRKQVERAGGMEEFFGIRPYRAGDSLKMIEWKRTARTGEMVSREMTQPSPPRVMVLLDLTTPTAAAQVGEGDGSDDAAAQNGESRRRGKVTVSQPSPPAKEKAISLAASLICDAHFHGYQIGLTVTGVKTPGSPIFPVHHSLPHRTKMLEALAALDLSKPETRPGATRITERPSVIVWPGRGDGQPPMGDIATGASGGTRRTAILGAADLDQYVSGGLGAAGSDSILSRRVRPTSRREEIAHQERAQT